MDILEYHRDGALVIAPHGRVDSTTSVTLDERLRHHLGAGARRVVVDLAQVDYISSAGLRVMLALAKRLREVQGTLVLCAMTEPVRQVFELAGFVPLFTVDTTLDVALARLSP
ncbi:MAG: STAS domain-containing protein [Vicinamibacterales bacterium]